MAFRVRTILRRPTSWRVLISWGIHLYTAVGLPIAMVTLIFTTQGAYRIAFILMTIATAIDATDGFLARKVEVKKTLPNFDGAKLDDIVDYLNFVATPVFLAWYAGLLPAGYWGLLVASAPLLASGYGFSNTAAKTADHYFTGFPSYWNIVVLYLFLLDSPVWLNTSLLVLLSILVFVPIRYLYPSRNKNSQTLLLTLGGVWTLMVLRMIWLIPTTPHELIYLSMFYPLLYTGLSFYYHFTEPK